ncbi:MAG: hypothetical protein WD063_04510 [Pirellulales bacterium]
MTTITGNSSAKTVVVGVGVLSVAPGLPEIAPPGDKNKRSPETFRESRGFFGLSLPQDGILNSSSGPATRRAKEVPKVHAEEVAHAVIVARGSFDCKCAAPAQSQNSHTGALEQSLQTDYRAA